MASTWRNLMLILFGAGCLCACAKDKPASASAQPSQSASLAATAKQVEAAPTSNRAAKPVVNGPRAMQYVKEIVAFGPRYLGSPGHAKVEGYLRAHLKADDLL